MSITIGKPQILFGKIESKPQLPKGWEYFEDDQVWLTCRSPKGGFFAVGTDSLYPIIEKEIIVAKRIDTKNPIKIPV